MNKITKRRQEESDEEIYKLRKSVSYDIRELTIEIIVSKYMKGLELDEDDNSESFGSIYVPEYQRDFTWDVERQSKLIESILLGLPIPLIFVAENKNGSWEIVDGSQRIRTLAAFINNDLKLKSLKKLKKINGFYFADLLKSRKSKFLNVPMRMIVLSENATDEVKKDMFERINRGSDLLKPMEKRKGIYLGPFRDYLYNECSKNVKFDKLAPIDKWLKKRQEKEELILRYFALSDNFNYKKYPNHSGISKYLDKYLNNKNKELEKLTKDKLKEKLVSYDKDFNEMLNFVEKNLKYGFRINSLPKTKRVVFEAISVGVYSALKENPNIKPDKEKLYQKLNLPEFHKLIKGNKEMHRSQKVIDRIDYVKNAILKS